MDEGHEEKRDNLERVENYESEFLQIFEPYLKDIDQDVRIREKDFEDVQLRMDKPIDYYGEGGEDRTAQDLFKIFGEFYQDFRLIYYDIKEKEEQEKRKAEREAKK